VQNGFCPQESLKNKLIFPPVFLTFVENSNRMTALQKAEALLPEMSKGEKAQLMKWVFSDLGEAFAGIEKTTGVCGGSACIIRTRIPVWLLAEARNAGASEAALLKSYPALRAEDLINAWAYYRVNKEEIDREIRENEEV
jgi:uncharacterized protein (DUF433 family)